MYRLLDLAGPEQASEVRQFLTELPEIRSRRSLSSGGTRGRISIARPLSGTGSRSDRGDECSRRRVRGGSSRRPGRRAKEGRCHSRALGPDSSRAERLAVNPASGWNSKSILKVVGATQATGQAVRTNGARLERDGQCQCSKSSAGVIHYAADAAHTVAMAILEPRRQPLEESVPREKPGSSSTNTFAAGLLASSAESDRYMFGNNSFGDCAPRPIGYMSHMGAEGHGKP